MIFGITLKHFARLQEQGENAKASARTIRLLEKEPKPLKTKSLIDLKFCDFVDLEKYFEQQDYISFCRTFVQKKFWQTIYVHNLKAILEDYGNQKKELFEQYQYIFDPPQYGEPVKETVGSELRKEFVEQFGPYVVLMDIVCKGRLSDYRQVEQWTLGEFLFWANYLSGQKIIEAIK